MPVASTELREIILPYFSVLLHTFIRATRRVRCPLIGAVGDFHSREAVGRCARQQGRDNPPSAAICYVYTYGSPGPSWGVSDRDQGCVRTKGADLAGRYDREAAAETISVARESLFDDCRLLGRANTGETQ